MQCCNDSKKNLYLIFKKCIKVFDFDVKNLLFSFKNNIAPGQLGGGARGNGELVRGLPSIRLHLPPSHAISGLVRFGFGIIGLVLETYIGVGSTIRSWSAVQMKQLNTI